MTRGVEEAAFRFDSAPARPMAESSIAETASGSFIE